MSVLQKIKSKVKRAIKRRLKRVLHLDGEQNCEGGGVHR